jgi:hypothetical protein
MRAAAAKETVTALVVAVDHEIFAKKPDRLDRPRAIELVDQSRRLPVAAQQFARGSVRSGPGDAIVLFCAEHGDPPKFRFTSKPKQAMFADRTSVR